MNKLVIPQLLSLVGFVATYLIIAPQALAQEYWPIAASQVKAQEPLPYFPLMQIEGLRFDTSLPLTGSPSLKPGSLNLLSSLQFGTFEPVMMTTTQDMQELSDILIPPVLAEDLTENVVLGTKVSESSESSELVEEISSLEATDSGQISMTQKKTVLTSTTGSITPLAAATTPSLVLTVKPTIKPTSKPTVAPTEKPAATPTATGPTGPLSNGGLNADLLFDMSNNFRKERGLAPFVKDDRACALAVSRAPEIGAEISGGHMHSGLRARNLPYWNSENIISMRTEKAAFDWWVNDKIHHDQIVGDYKYSCVACHGNSCVQEFSNYIYKR